MSKPAIPIRHVVAVFIGNALSFYDFVTFSYFSTYIGRTFFPSHDPSISLLASLATFGVGFVMRPVGAFFIGRMGDRIGRKPAMLMTFALLGIGITGMALTPSYAAIGVAAPVIVILFRLVQGFALGGEVGPTTAYMAEAAPPHRRGLYLSMQYATQDCATLLAGIVGVALAAMLSDAQLESWGWRVALLIGASIVPFGLLLRRSLPETLHAATAETVVVESAATARSYLPIVVFGLMMLTAGTIGSYTIGYMTTYALNTLKLTATVSFGLTIINGVFSIIFEATSGWLADRYGRKPVMIVPGVLLLLSILPCFWLITHVGGIAVLYGTQAWMVALAGLSSTPAIIAITESLPPAIRSGAVALIYAFAISIFGGSTQFVITALIKWTGNPLAPALYWSAALVVGLIAMALVKESAPGKLPPR
ncbi:MAG TPA: MFS transporter [Rhizomicrobium sp.]|jgi:MFS family permease|nr:MFS transporter [Rhizomicrobium sp.]